MIKVYLAAISTHYEGEDIEIRYSILQEEELISKKNLYHDYEKPAVVNLLALQILIRELEKMYQGETIQVMINDAAINEQIKGTSQTKNRDVLKMSRITREALSRGKNTLLIKDISTNQAEIAKWNEILKP